MSERHARRIVTPLVERGLLESEGRSAPFTIGFPLEEADLIFPRLFQMPAAATQAKFLDAARSDDAVDDMPAP